VFEIEHEVYEKGSLHWPLSRRGKGLPQNIEIKRYVWHSPPKEGGKLHVKTWICMRLAPVFRKASPSPSQGGEWRKRVYIG
jgi:hypothetical protein